MALLLQFYIVIVFLNKNDLYYYIMTKFNKNFIYSKLSKKIDAIDSSIVGNISFANSVSII